MEFRMKIPVVLLVGCLWMSVFFFLGCQKDEDHNSNKNRKITRVTVTNNPPARYTLYDEDCIRDQNRVKINRTGIWGWEGLSVTNATAELINTLSIDSLKSEVVSRTTYDRLYLRICNGPSELDCVKSNGKPKGWDMPQKNNLLWVCEDDFTYPRDTYEAGALTSLHYLNQAGRAYTEAMGQPLRKVHLEVFPLFESQFFGRTDRKSGKKVDVKEYLVDNLAYYPGHDLIVVFPQSQEGAASGIDKYWESSFVLAHELGHHVEQVHVGATLQSLGVQWDPMLHAYRGLIQDGSDAARRQSQVAIFWTVISEAFADLNAYYAGKEDVTSLANVDCLGANRNITAELFADNETAKKLTEAVVLNLMTGSRFIAYCNAVDFAEPHTVGAIVAHNLQRIIAILEPSESDLPSPPIINARYRRSITWIKTMAAMQTASQNNKFSSKTLFTSLGPAIEALGADASDRQKAEICELAKAQLPVLSPPPFASSCQGF